MKFSTRKIAALVALVALSILSLAPMASADVAGQTQTYTTAWDELPTAQAALTLQNGKTLLVTSNVTGDYQTGINSPIVATTTSTADATLDVSVTVVPSLYSVKVVRVAQLSSGKLLLVYYGEDIVRYLTKNVIGYSVSDDSGLTWSEPTLLPAPSDYYFENLRVLEDDSDRTYIFALSGQSINYYWVSTASSLSEWQLKQREPLQWQDYGIFREDFDLSASKWNDGQLYNVEFIASSKSIKANLKTFGNFDTQGGLVGTSKIFTVTAKSKASTSSSNSTGDIVAAVLWVDAAKYLRVTYRIFSATSKTWSLTATKKFGKIKNVNLFYFDAWLADNQELAFSYQTIARDSKVTTWLRTVNLQGSVSAAIDFSGVFASSNGFWSLYEKYEGGGAFTFVFGTYGTFEESYLNQTLHIKRGVPAAMTETTFDGPNIRLLQTRKNLIFSTADVGTGIDAGTESPNTIQVHSYPTSSSEAGVTND